MAARETGGAEVVWPNQQNPELDRKVGEEGPLRSCSGNDRLTSVQLFPYPLANYAGGKSFDQGLCQRLRLLNVWCTACASLSLLEMINAMSAKAAKNVAFAN